MIEAIFESIAGFFSHVIGRIIKKRWRIDQEKAQSIGENVVFGLAIFALILLTILYSRR